MILEEDKYNELSPGSHAHIKLKCDSGKNTKCLNIFTREKRTIVKQRARTADRDFCKFCQKTEEYSGRGNPNTKYFFDDNFLSNIDTPDKAYLLGWIASDGSIRETGICVVIRDYDIEVLKALRAIVDTNLPIAERDNKVSLTINSSKIAQDCRRHLKLPDFGSKHSLVKYPELCEELDVYFIRGYFDGDGSVSLHNRVPRASIASNSIDMLQSIKQKCGYGTVYESSSGPQWQINNGGEAIQFLSYLYSDISVPYLERKYFRYLDVLDWVPSRAGSGSSVKFNTTQGLIKFNKSRSDAILPTISDIHASGIDLHLIEKVKEFTQDVSLYTKGIKITSPEG